MKKKKLNIIVFTLTFIVTYLCICFCVPGMRIKLEAEPLELFIKSIEHMALFKCLISLILGAAVLLLVNIIKNKKR
ncbi:MAG: hypothetical protein Q4F12_03555 [Erysipelotrichaceae bacterium]|nr:hypothetical protein [Erysipelotrichaceae bacterium]